MRAGGLPAASSAGQPLARGVRADPRRGHQRAGWHGVGGRSRWKRLFEFPIPCLGLRLAGDAIEEVDARGNRIIDDTLFIVLNAHYESTAFVLPAHRPKVRWELVLDTRGMLDKRRHRPLRGGEVYEMAARSLALFCRRRNHGNHVPRLA